jgi:hypothetical protein
MGFNFKVICRGPLCRSCAAPHRLQRPPLRKGSESRGAAQVGTLSLWRQRDLFFLIKEKTSGSIHLLQFLFTGLFFFFMVLYSFLVWFSCLKISVALFHPCTQRQNISLRSVKQSAKRLIIDRRKRTMIQDNTYRAYRSLSYEPKTTAA